MHTDYLKSKSDIRGTEIYCSEPFADLCWLRLPKAFGKMNMIQVGDFVNMRLIIDVGLIFFRVSAQTVLD